MCQTAICQCALCLSLCVLLGIQAGEMSEAEKRAQFTRAMASAKPEDRVAAVETLKGASENASLLLLRKAAVVDAAESVRMAAFQVISDWDDTLGQMEPIIVEIFCSEKNLSTKIAMAQRFVTLKTKTVAIQEAIRFFCTLNYPQETLDSYNKNRARWEAEDAARNAFKDMLTVINTLTDQTFIVSSSPKTEVTKWWALHRNEYMKADAEMRVKLRNEASAAATRK